jgi:hypothetical protein
MRYKLYMLATAILIASGTVSSALGLLAPGPALPGNRSLRDRFSRALQSGDRKIKRPSEIAR